MGKGAVLEKSAVDQPSQACCRADVVVANAADNFVSFFLGVKAERLIIDSSLESPE